VSNVPLQENTFVYAMLEYDLLKGGENESSCIEWQSQEKE
jgi:hypothetical protein